MQAVEPQARHYDRTTIWLHWLTAGLVVLQWALAQAIDLFPQGAPRVGARSVHIMLGLVLGAVLVSRLLWRATQGRRLPAADQGVRHTVAKATHWGLYVLLVATVALGVFLVWARGDSIFGLFTVPAYDPTDRGLADQVLEVHGIMASLILALAGLHAAAALAHRFLWRDGVLARMLPDRKRSGP